MVVKMGITEIIYGHVMCVQQCEVVTGCQWQGEKKWQQAPKEEEWKKEGMLWDHCEIERDKNRKKNNNNDNNESLKKTYNVIIIITKV